MSGSDTTSPPSSPPNQIPGGHHPDPGGLQTGEFGLEGDLRSAMTQALEQVWGQGDGDEGEGNQTDDAATDAPAQDPAPPPPPGDGTGGAGAGGEAAGEEAATDPAAAPAPAPTPSTDPASEDFSLDEYAAQYFGTRLTPQQARDLFGVLGGLQSLTPEKREYLDRVLSGQEQVPSYPATTGQPITPQPSPTPTSTPPPSSPSQLSPSNLPPTLPPRPDDEYEAAIYDRYIAPLYNSFDQRLTTIQSQIEQTTQAQLIRQQQEASTRIESASTAWRADHPDLTDAEYDSLTDSIVRSGTFPALVQAHGSIEAATRAAFEQHFWATPHLRERAIANIASGRAPGDRSTPDPSSPTSQANLTADLERQARAASVAGGGGAATPRGATPPPTTPEGRKSAMIAELGNSMG